MINKVINIDIDFEAMGVEKSPRQTTLTSFILDKKNIEVTMKKKRPAVIVCPGGGYACTSPREGEPIAMKYCAAGFHTFILEYSVAPAGYPAALCELSKAVAYVKSIADEYNIDKNKIFVIGFSAGGHLVASLGVHHSRPEVLKFAKINEGDNIPTGLLLGYPVITAEEGKTHQGTIDNFSANRDEVQAIASLEKFVNSKTPPCFIWHTFNDGAVPVASSLRFATALQENGVPFELHIYPNGEHGLATSDRITACSDNGIITAVQNWVDMSIRWINEM